MALARRLRRRKGRIGTLGLLPRGTAQRRQGLLLPWSNLQLPISLGVHKFKGSMGRGRYQTGKTGGISGMQRALFSRLHLVVVISVWEVSIFRCLRSVLGPWESQRSRTLCWEGSRAGMQTSLSKCPTLPCAGPSKGKWVRSCGGCCVIWILLISIEVIKADR